MACEHTIVCLYINKLNTMKEWDYLVEVPNVYMNKKLKPCKSVSDNIFFLLCGHVHEQPVLKTQLEGPS